MRSADGMADTDHDSELLEAWQPVLQSWRELWPDGADSAELGQMPPLLLELTQATSADELRALFADPDKAEQLGHFMASWSDQAPQLAAAMVEALAAMMEAEVLSDAPALAASVAELVSASAELAQLGAALPDRVDAFSRRWSLLQQVEANMLLGQIEPALALLEQAQALTDQLATEGYLHGELMLTRVRLLAATGHDIEQIGTHAAEGIGRWATEAGGLQDIAWKLLDEARACRWAGITDLASYWSWCALRFGRDRCDDPQLLVEALVERAAWHLSPAPQLDAAAELLEEALQSLAGADLGGGPYEACVLIRLGHATRTQDPVLALHHARRALGLLEQAGSSYSGHAAAALYVMGMARELLSDLPGSERCFVRSLEALQGWLTGHRPDLDELLQATVTSMKAGLAQRDHPGYTPPRELRRKVAHAVAVFRPCPPPRAMCWLHEPHLPGPPDLATVSELWLELARSPDEDPVQLDGVLAAQSRRAALRAAEQGDLPQATATLRRALSQDHRRLLQLHAAGPRAQQVARVRDFHRWWSRYLELVRRVPDDSEELQAAYELVLRTDGLGHELLGAVRELVRARHHPELEESFERWLQARRQIGEAVLAGATAVTEELDEWWVTSEELELALFSQVPSLAIEQRLRAATVAAVSQALPPGAALVDIVRTDPQWDDPVDGERSVARYLAFLLHAGAASARLVDLGPAGPIDALVDQGCGPLGGARGARDIGGTSQTTAVGGLLRLRRAAFDPLRSALGPCTQVCLSVDGELARVPFGILPEDDDSLLVDRFALSYVDRGRDVLLHGAGMATPGGPPLVLAGPDFELGPAPPAEGARQHFDPLPGAAREGEQVAAALGVEAHSGADALEGLLKAARSPRILHLATHGFFLERAGRTQDPMLRSGLALAGANRGTAGGLAEDGILTADDASGLDLCDTELVVLSACDTGLGDTVAGEGVIGLRRAFALAGARTVIMSLWRVPDQETCRLMACFYRHLLAGRGRAESLRRAQQELRAAHPDPAIWGAFICVGDPGPLGGGD